jgi:hypothetical protein
VLHWVSGIGAVQGDKDLALVPEAVMDAIGELHPEATRDLAKAHGLGRHRGNHIAACMSMVYKGFRELCGL